jgi:hypothetical protein
MKSKLGKIVQKSVSPTSEDLVNPRLKCILDRVQKSTFALLERVRDVRQKCKIANCDQASSCGNAVVQFRRTIGAKLVPRRAREQAPIRAQPSPAPGGLGPDSNQCLNARRQQINKSRANSITDNTPKSREISRFQRPSTGQTPLKPARTAAYTNGSHFGKSFRWNCHRGRAGGSGF